MLGVSLQALSLQIKTSFPYTQSPSLSTLTGGYLHTGFSPHSNTGKVKVPTNSSLLGMQRRIVQVAKSRCSIKSQQPRTFLPPSCCLHTSAESLSPATTLAQIPGSTFTAQLSFQHPHSRKPESQLKGPKYTLHM